MQQNRTDEIDPIVNELVSARKALGWTQNELHTRTGISRDVIKGYESGRNKPGAREIRLLCEALGISPNRLLYGQDSFDSKKTGLDEFVNHPGLDEVARLGRTIALLQMLTESERAAILTLVISIVTGRNGGADKVIDTLAAISVLTEEYEKDYGETMDKIDQGLAILNDDKAVELAEKAKKRATDLKKEV